MTTSREITKVYLNTWGAYNEGSIGFGWMTPAQAKEFIEKNPERCGGEWFIADIDNYLGVEFGSLDYANVQTIIETIETLEELEEWELNEVVALMEYLNTDSALEALDKKDNYTFYADKDEYHDFCDECIFFDGNALMERYFDYDAYHRDCDFDIYEAENGVCIQG